jgi:uncharacterized membrane protein
MEEKVMSNLFVVTFDTENGADRLITALGDWQKQKLIKIDDAATVVKKADGKIKTKHADNLVGSGAKKGAIIGGVIGIVFLNPAAGAAAGSAVGAVVGRRQTKKRAQVGIDDKFIKEVASSVKPGGSAVFAYTEKGVVEKILPQLKQFNGHLIQSSLTPEDEAMIKQAFEAQEKEPVGAKK